MPCSSRNPRLPKVAEFLPELCPNPEIPRSSTETLQWLSGAAHLHTCANFLYTFLRACRSHACHHATNEKDQFERAEDPSLEIQGILEDTSVFKSSVWIGLQHKAKIVKQGDMMKYDCVGFELD